jgi:hypothetical protein
LTHEFADSSQPIIPLLVVSRDSGVPISTLAYLDTGADITMLDVSPADGLNIDLSQATSVDLRGIGAEEPARIATVDLVLLKEQELTVTVDVAFARWLDPRVGNLIGIDVLEHFDFGLSHSQRVGYLGRSLA